MIGARPAAPRWAAIPVTAAVLWLCIIAAARGGVAAPVGVLASATELLAAIVRSLLGGMGIEAARIGPLVYVPGAFAYEVALGCTGLLPAAVLVVAIVASPAPAAAKRWGVGVGVLGVLALNVARLLHLFYLGVYAPEWFAIAHAGLWEITIVTFTVATWAAWWRCAGRSQRGRLARPLSS